MQLLEMICELKREGIGRYKSLSFMFFHMLSSFTGGVREALICRYKRLHADWNELLLALW